MKYAVTGATGFLGGHLARQLVQAGHLVRALVRSPEKAGALGALGVELHPGDITDRASLAAPFTGIDGLFHCAAWYKTGARDKRPAQRVNVDGTRNVLEVASERDVPRIVYTSTLAVFGDTHGRLVTEEYRHDGPHSSEYDRTKWEAHYRVALPMIEAGLPLVVVQPGVIYGPGDTSALQRTFQQYLDRRLPMTPQDTAYCWAHVDDVAHAHVLAMERGRIGESYIIAGPPHTLIEAFAIAESITGIPAPKLHPPAGLMRALAAVMGVVEAIVPLPELYTAEGLRAVSGVTYIGDNSKARRELGYAPRPLGVGLRDILPSR